MAQVGLLYATDLKENHLYYQENFNEIILNSVYPSRLEKDFLKHIEVQQQKKNDSTYKKLL
jgi:hypothetical protein